MIGPRNATPAQRVAALQNRACTQQELTQELFAATAVYDVYQWPVTDPPEGEPPRGSASQRGCSTTVGISHLHHAQVDRHRDADLTTDNPLSFYTIVTHSQATAADRDGVSIVSPLWGASVGRP